MRTFLSLWILCLIGIQSAWASQQTLSSQDEQLQEWITYYYLCNDVSEVGDFLKRIEDSQILKNPIGPGLSILGFLLTIFSDNPEQVQEWVKDTNFTGVTKTAVKYALQLSGNGKIVTDVFQEAPESASSTPVCLPDSVLKTPEDINVMGARSMRLAENCMLKRSLMYWMMRCRLQAIKQGTHRPALLLSGL